MCGRFSISVNKEDLLEYVGENYYISEINNNIVIPRYNVSPGQDIISIINDGNKNRLGLLKWGFIPSFANEDYNKYNIINAKSETLHEKKSFRDSMINKRCIILSDGFYEWKKVSNEKEPYRIKVKDKTLFPIAGLWSSYTKKDGTKGFTCAIVTTKSNTFMSNIHERMPVILNEDISKIWLDPKITDYKIIHEIINTSNLTNFDSYRVSKVVNKSSNEIIDCIVPIR